MRLSAYILLLSGILYYLITPCYADPGSGPWKKDSYKRYTGTIDGRPVVVNLHWGAKCKDCSIEWSGGSTCYFQGQQGMHNISMSDTHNDDIILWEEASIYEKHKEEAKPRRIARWQVHINGNKMQGKRIKTVSGEYQEINLIEDYINAYAFETVRLRDTALLHNAVSEEFYAESYYASIKPAASVADEDASFINNFLLQYFRADTLGVTTWQDFPKAYTDRFIEQQQKLAPLLRVDVEDEDGTRHLFKEHAHFFIEAARTARQTFFMFPVYNSDGILVLEVADERLERNTNSPRGHSHICMDIKERRQWTAQDILDITAPQLVGEIEQLAHKLSNAKDGEPLQLPFNVQEIPVTDNIIITETGLYFCYNPGEIADVSEEEFRFFVAYSEVSTLLTDEFKKRMQL